jgi:hypothetical protein
VIREECEIRLAVQVRLIDHAPITTILEVDFLTCILWQQVSLFNSQRLYSIDT